MNLTCENRAITSSSVPIERGDVAVNTQLILGRRACKRLGASAALTLRSRLASPRLATPEGAGPLTKG